MVKKHFFLTYNGVRIFFRHYTSLQCRNFFRQVFPCKNFFPPNQSSRYFFLKSPISPQKHDLIYTWYKPSSNGISFIILTTSTGVSTRKESKQSDQRLENLSSEQKQVHCNDYESLITISGGKKAKPRYNKTYKYTHHGKVSFFWRCSIIHHVPNSTV